MSKIKKIITARPVSLVLLLLLLGLIYLSIIIPQKIDSSAAHLETWRFGHLALTGIIDLFSLHAIYSQPWFAVLILLMTMSLVVSSYDQLIAARKKMLSTTTTAAEAVAIGISAQQLASAAACHRYRPVETDNADALKFIRNPWGYFGNLLLHAGMTVVIIVSLYHSLYSRQGALIMVEGEERSNDQTWNISEHGLLASPLTLPGAIRLDRVSLKYDNKHQPAEVLSDISIIDTAGQTAHLTASINRVIGHNGLRIYHASQYGNAFLVSFTDRKGTTHTETVAAHHPLNLSEAGYSDDFTVSWSPYLLSAKYFTSVQRDTMNSDNPELVLRLADKGKELARTRVTIGRNGMLGEYRVELKKVVKWSTLIFVDTNGMPILFTGFAIIMLGGLIRYLFPPRELIAIKQKDEHFNVFWKASEFRSFFLEERDMLITDLQTETTT